MPEVSGYENVYTPEGVQTEPEVPVEERSDYLVRVKRGDIRALEAQAKGAADAKAEAAAANRRAAFALAGIDTESKDESVALFVRGYDGELTPEKIRAAGEKFKVIQAENPSANGTESEGEKPPPDAKLEEGEQKLHDEKHKLGENAPPDTAQPGDPYSEAERTIQSVMKQGGQEKEAIGAALNGLVNAAHNGDKRVILSRRAGVDEE